MQISERQGGRTAIDDRANDDIEVVGPNGAAIKGSSEPNRIKHSFRGEDGIDSWTGNLNFPANTSPRDIAKVVSRSGRRGLKIEIERNTRQWENDAAILPRTPKRRAEFSWRPWRIDGSGKEGWAGAAFYLPSDPMADVKGCTIFQLHNHPDKGELLQLYCIDGRLRADNDGSSKNQQIMDVPLKLFLDRWVDMVVHYRAGTGSDGFLKLFLDGVEMIDIRGPNKKGSDTKGPYFKNGLYFWGYKNDPKKKAVALFDTLWVGD